MTHPILAPAPTHPRLGSQQLGFSRLFCAEVVRLWRTQDPDRSFTVDDLLYDPRYAYYVIRAAGADSLSYERSAGRRRARVLKWMEYFATSRRPLPTHDGRDDAYLIQDTDDPIRFRLVAAQAA